MTAIDFRANPVTARRYRVGSLVTRADIPDIIWAEDETGCYRVRGRNVKRQTDRREAVGPIRIVTDVRSRQCRTLGEDNRLPTNARVRAFLENFAKRQIPITYQELAKALQILPPHSIHRVTEALERLMEEDAAADRPFIAALAISKARGGLPAPGFFECARRLGRFAGDPDGQDAWSFHADELNAVFARWGGSRD
jgi:hypothetical protein